ncbi:FtsX-like permease family protein [Haoranjiania flava]|uniref:ABC transporter permease n=1 Tax=Haoranjiania flava TaxID=1856322 RepID=A0AAE3INP9_9BACT|nr:FtsX-like permease family protein [Haoranjiania flava]MCU7694475.1 hypothetical protein [Haoranjiania flava]
MLEKLLKKLIKTGSGRWRKLMAVTGLGIAMLLILAAVQLQADYNELLHGRSNQDSIANFLVVNKAVTSANIGNTQLSQQEIEDLRSRPFIKSVGLITASRFRVAISGSLLPFSTDLFFESVPDEFLDISGPEWRWDENAQFIPVVVPNSFLDLYNFGYAASAGSPQLTQEVVTQIPLQITIFAPSGQTQYPAKVVGFSDRISSILVPQPFMEWANEKFGSAQAANPSRVVIRTEDPGNPQLTQYLESKGLKTDTEKTRFSKYRQVVNFVVGISWGTGLAMLLFALLIFTLFIELTIMASREEIKLLITLGSSPTQLKKFLMKEFFPQNIFITLVMLIVVAVFQYILFVYLKTQHMFVSPLLSVYTILVALLVLLVLWVVNLRTIHKVASAASL